MTETLGSALFDLLAKAGIKKGHVYTMVEDVLERLKSEQDRAEIAEAKIDDRDALHSAALELADADQRLRRHEDAQPRAVGSREWTEWRRALDPLRRKAEEARAKFDRAKGGESG